MRFKEGELDKFIPENLRNSSEDQTLYVSLFDSLEIVRLAKIGWQIEENNRLSHVKHCDRKFCLRPELHIDPSSAGTRGADEETDTNRRQVEDQPSLFSESENDSGLSALAVEVAGSL